MPFQSGKSGNDAGRLKGTPNKATKPRLYQFCSVHWKAGGLIQIKESGHLCGVRGHPAEDARATSPAILAGEHASGTGVGERGYIGQHNAL